MTIEAEYFDYGNRFSISIPQSLIPDGNPDAQKSSKRTSKRFLFLIGLCITVFYQIITLCSRNVRSKAIRGLSKPQEPSYNARKVKNWRSEIQAACQAANTADDMADVLTMARDDVFPFSGLGLERKIIDPDFLPGNHMLKCPYVLIDLGSGVGNSIMDFIDSGLVGCTLTNRSSQGVPRMKKVKALSFPPLHFHADGTLRDMTKSGKDESNEEFKTWVQDRVKNFDSSLGPEDYCVYGVEGNPLLKHKLKSLEQNIARMDPSPLQHVHMLTRTVAGGEPGHPIFIDHAHEKDDSPGSSLYFNHAHLRESRDTYGNIVEYKVDTTSLTTLMKQTLSHYHEEDEKIETTRNHLILNIDVEGSEFDILNEAKNSGILCNFALEGNFVDIFVRYHSPDLLGIETAAMRQYMHEIRPYFERQCGDTLNLYEKDKFF